MFITLDGVDGAGKTSLIGRVCDYIKSKGYSCVTTREPGGSPSAESLRSLILNTPTSPLAETYLFAAARADHCSDVIIPHMLDGTWVLCDRFTASTYVYQVCEKKVDRQVYTRICKTIEELFFMCGFSTVASIEFILDCDFETSKARILARGEKLNLLDTLDLDVFNRRRDSYLDYAGRTERAVLIDANGSPSHTLHQVVHAIEKEILAFESRLSADYKLLPKRLT